MDLMPWCFAMKILNTGKSELKINLITMTFSNIIRTNINPSAANDKS